MVRLMTTLLLLMSHAQNERLKEQNMALKKNISCLYKTARSELDRKESMISRLMARCVCVCEVN